jgi:hypothetical protein
MNTTQPDPNEGYPGELDDPESQLSGQEAGELEQRLTILNGYRALVGLPAFQTSLRTQQREMLSVHLEAIGSLWNLELGNKALAIGGRRPVQSVIDDFGLETPAPDLPGTAYLYTLTERPRGGRPRWAMRFELAGSGTDEAEVRAVVRATAGEQVFGPQRMGQSDLETGAYSDNLTGFLGQAVLAYAAGRKLG